MLFFTTALKAPASLMAAGAALLLVASSSGVFCSQARQDMKVSTGWQKMLVQAIATTSPPRGCTTSVKMKDSLWDSTAGSASVGFDAQNKFLWGMQVLGIAYWAKISMCVFLSVSLLWLRAPCSKYKLVKWHGKSIWLQECPGPPFWSPLKQHHPKRHLGSTGGGASKCNK